MIRKPHLSKRSIRWKAKTNNGDPCKYYVYEVIGRPREIGGNRAFIVICRILTKEPQNYTNNPVILRLCRGMALIETVETHTAQSWLIIGNAVGTLMGNKNNDK